MQKNNRFIKFPLWLFEWEWVNFENYAVAFLKLVQRANRTPSRWQGIDIGVGEFVSSLKGIAETCGMTEQKARTFLKRCENSELLEKSSTASFTKIKIIDFEIYFGNSSKTNTESNTELTRNLTRQPTRLLTRSKEPSNADITSNSDEESEGANTATNTVANTVANTKLTRYLTNEQHTANKPLTTVIDNNRIYIDSLREGEGECACTHEETPTPPLAEIQEFCSERKSSVNPVRFYNYYSRVGWTSVGDWRLKIQEWENNEFSSADKSKKEKLETYLAGSSGGLGDFNLEDFDEGAKAK